MQQQYIICAKPMSHMIIGCLEVISITPGINQGHTISISKNV